VDRPSVDAAKVVGRAMSRIRLAFGCVVAATGVVVYLLAAAQLTPWAARMPLGHAGPRHLGFVLLAAAALAMALEAILTRHVFYEIWILCWVAVLEGGLAVVGAHRGVVLLPLTVGGVVLALATLHWLLTNRWAFILLRATLGSLLIGGGALLAYHGLESRRVEGVAAAIAIFWAPGAILAAAGTAFLLSLRRRQKASWTAK
jgi:hypothetical protein